METNGASGDELEASAASKERELRVKVVFISTSNEHKKMDANKMFCDKLKEDLRADKKYAEKRTLLGFMRVCVGLIKW